jgi:hypothetical protein
MLMHGGRVVPEMRDGKVLGVRLFGIRPGATLGLLGSPPRASLASRASARGVLANGFAEDAARVLL